MGEFTQYLLALCLCRVITSRARLRSRLHLSGQGPTPDPETWICTKPAALRCRRETRQARIPQRPARNAVHTPLESGSARHCILDAVSPNNTSKNLPLSSRSQSSQGFFWGVCSNARSSLSSPTGKLRHGGEQPPASHREAHSFTFIN